MRPRFLIATEQGLATIAALVTAAIIVGASGQKPRAIASQLGATLAIGAATYCAVLVVLGGPAGFIGALHYNFGIVPKDQFWYFGGPPNRFLFSLRQFLSYPWIWVPSSSSSAPRAQRCGCAVSGSTSERRRSRALRAELFLGLYAAFSIVPIFGTFVEVYLQPGGRAGLILGLLAASPMGKGAARHRGGSCPLNNDGSAEGRACGVTALVVLQHRSVCGRRPATSRWPRRSMCSSRMFSRVTHQPCHLTGLQLRTKDQRSSTIFSEQRDATSTRDLVHLRRDRRGQRGCLQSELRLPHPCAWTGQSAALHQTPSRRRTSRPGADDPARVTDPSRTKNGSRTIHWEFYRDVLRDRYDCRSHDSLVLLLASPSTTRSTRLPPIVAEGGLN